MENKYRKYLSQGRIKKAHKLGKKIMSIYLDIYERGVENEYQGDTNQRITRITRVSTQTAKSVTETGYLGTT